jgi:2,4-dienoyl-CoA reductase-like NADH-dependent reductase (Old Yellow Enzyme family)
MSVLFETTRIKGMELKNRFVRSATHEGMSDENGFPTQALFKLYERLAKGGCGLIVTGYAFVSKEGKGHLYRMQGIDSDAFIPKYRELVDHVHAHGARIAMQICHCGRQTTEEATGTRPMGPSRVKDRALFVKPREMNEEDIERVIEAFGQAARRVRESGFDAVQIHGAHGYLVSQFICPHTNRRKDRWGGSTENRMRFVRELYNRCRKEVGDDYPILIKISSQDNMKKGLKLSEGVRVAQMMADMGFDGLEVSCGIFEDGFTMARGDLPIDLFMKEWPMYRKMNPLSKFLLKRFADRILRPIPLTEAYNREAAREIKGKVNVPVFLVGGLSQPAVMEEIIERGEADYISLCRPLIADSKFPERIRQGSSEPSMCIYCNYCGGYMISEPLRCYRGKALKRRRP